MEPMVFNDTLAQKRCELYFLIPVKSKIKIEKDFTRPEVLVALSI
jgi:hypothetical protein